MSEKTASLIKAEANREPSIRGDKEPVFFAYDESTSVSVDVEASTPYAKLR